MRLVISLKDTATPVVIEAAEIITNGLALHKAAAAGALPAVQKRFRQMAGSEHNRFGVRSSFWNRMLSGTKTLATASEATIRMPREVALRYFGGTVQAHRPRQYLTIPLRAEAYGKSPREFDQIKFARIGGKLFAFTTDVEDRGRGETGSRMLKRYRKNYTGRRRITLLYLLLSSATVRPNKSVLPTDAELLAGASEGVSTLVQMKLARAKAAAATAAEKGAS